MLMFNMVCVSVVKSWSYTGIDLAPLWQIKRFGPKGASRIWLRIRYALNYILWYKWGSCCPANTWDNGLVTDMKSQQRAGVSVDALRCPSNRQAYQFLRSFGMLYGAAGAETFNHLTRLLRFQCEIEFVCRITVQVANICRVREILVDSRIQAKIPHFHGFRLNVIPRHSENG